MYGAVSSSGLGIVSARWEGSDADGLRLAFVGGLSWSIVQSIVQRRVQSRIQTIRMSRGRCALFLAGFQIKDTKSCMLMARFSVPMAAASMMVIGRMLFRCNSSCK